MSSNTYRSLSATQNTIVSLLSQRVFSASAASLAPEDWNAVLNEAEQQSVFPVVYQAAAGMLSGSAAGGWKTRYHQHISHNFNVINAHYEAHDLLAAAGIPYTVIKGCASSFYYPEPELRTMGDVDLYVEKSSMDRVHSLFTGKGYEASGLDHPHHWSYERDGVELEIHWVPSGIPAADDGTVRALFGDLLERSRPVTQYGQTMILPDRFHHGLIMLLHTANHLTAGGVGLRHLLDWLVFENSMTEAEFCDIFSSTLRCIGLWQFACVLTAIGVRFFGCAPRSFCSEVSEALSTGMLLDIFDGGNFGVKDADRLNQSKLLRDNESRQIRGGGELGHAIRFLNQRARTQFPAAARFPLLLPIGWGKVLRNRAKAVKTGKQSRVNLQATLRGAKEREMLYEQLRLFEE